MLFHNNKILIVQFFINVVFLKAKGVQTRGVNKLPNPNHKIFYLKDLTLIIYFFFNSVIS
jgi:hypothetical protein